MTFSQAVKLLDRKFPLFTEWAMKRGIFLFDNREEDEEGHIVFLEDKLFLLMKYLHQDYRSLLLMESKERNMYFRTLVSLLKEEANGGK